MTGNPVLGFDASYAVFEKETTYGSVPAGFPSSAAQWVDMSSSTLEDQRANVVTHRLTSSSIHWTRVFQAGNTVKGQLLLDMAYLASETLMEAAFGTRVSSQPNASSSPEVYDHEYVFGAVLPSLTVEIGYATHALQVTGVMVNKVTLSVLNNGFMQATLELIGQAATSYGAGELSPRTPDISDLLVNPLHWPGPGSPAGLSFDWYDRGAAKEANAATFELISFTATVDNQLQVKFVPGSATIRKPYRGGFQRNTGRILTEYNISDFEAFRFYQQGKAGRGEIKASGGTIPAVNPNGNDAAFSYEVEFDWSSMMLRGGTPKVVGPGVIVLDVPYEAFDGVTQSVTGGVPDDQAVVFRNRNNLDAALAPPT
jgi:hypothetical protein